MAVKRRRGNPGTSQSIVGLIWELADEHPDWPSKQVHSVLESKLKEMGYGSLVPGERTVRKKLAEFGRLHSDELDVPWSVGVSDKCGISPEATDDLLQVWRWCIAADRTFTIREAKWAARLRDVRPYIGKRLGSVPGKLYYYAWHYSVRERLSPASAVPGITADLDADLALSLWERGTFLDMYPKTERFVLPERLQSDRPHFSERCPSEVVEDDLIVRGGFDREDRRELHGFQPDDAEVSEEMDWIYAFWLQRVGQGPHWRNLSAKEHMDIVIRLRQWVKGHPWARRVVPPLETPDKPTEILKAVGYRFDSET